MRSTQIPDRPLAASESSNGDVPYTMKLPDGRCLFVEIPCRWVDYDHDGTILFLPRAVELLDRVQALAQRADRHMTPGHIIALRKALGMTQTQFAGKLHVNKMTVYRWERGSVRPKPESIAAIERLRASYAKRGVVIPT